MLIELSAIGIVLFMWIMYLMLPQHRHVYHLSHDDRPIEIVMDEVSTDLDSEFELVDEY
jgi:hypothetical protein